VTLTKSSRKVVEFDSYSPKAFASRRILPEDLADRCFTINMAPAPSPYPDPGASGENWRAMRTSLYQLLLTNYDAVQKLINHETKEPSRFGELWLPVSVLLSLVNEEAAKSKEIRDYCTEKFNLIRFELDDWRRALIEVVIDAPNEVVNKDLLKMLLARLDPKEGEAKPGETWLGKELRSLGLLKQSTRQHGGQHYVLNREHALEYVASESARTTYTPDTKQIVQDTVHPEKSVQDEPAQQEYPTPSPTLSEPNMAVQDDSFFQGPLSGDKVSPTGAPYLTAANRCETMLGMTIEKALETWQAAGAPVIHLGPGENCLELGGLLSCADVLDRHLLAVKEWLEKVMA